MALRSVIAAVTEERQSGSQRLRSAEEIRDANTRYHDVAAAGYDSKWGIDFGAVGRRQVLGKVRKLLGSELERGFERSLEVGAGTGYFTLNLLQAGVVREATCTDISPGMLSALAANARRLGLEVRSARADAEALPFGEESFDLVIGHAVLHHLPDLERAFSEFHRVLRPGGRLVFAGEPSRLGDLLARLPKRLAELLAPAWRTLLRARAAPPAGAPGSRECLEHKLEHVVDIHAFSPGQLSAHARRAGFTDVRVRGEELLANWFGWFNRGLEASAHPADVPMLWRSYAFHGYLALQHLDERLLEPLLPATLFYNLLLSARKAPASPAGGQPAAAPSPTRC
jgi:ubiquinone/menaquinone biosynthesis C-methylase UbiE